MTPHEAVYGYPPPPMVPFEPGTALDADIERQLRSRDDLLRALREAILLAHNCMRQHYNKGQKDREFEVGAWVLERLGKATYRLRLPPQAEVHPVFHVTRLKPFVGEPPAEIPALAGEDPSPCRIIRTRRARRQERLVDEVLVEWRNREERFTWEERDQIRQQYPNLHALGQACFKGGGSVTGHFRTRTASKAKVAGRPSQAKAVALQQQPAPGGKSGSSRSPANRTSAPPRRTAASKGPSPSCSGPCPGEVSHGRQALASLSQAEGELTTSITPSPRQAAEATQPKSPESRLSHSGLVLTQAKGTSEGYGPESSQLSQTAAQTKPTLEDLESRPETHESGLAQEGLKEEDLRPVLGQYSPAHAQASLQPEDLEPSHESHEFGLAQVDQQEEDLGSGPGHYSLALAQDDHQPEGLESWPSSPRASPAQEDEDGPGSGSPDLTQVDPALKTALSPA
ncbi:unnamed protein product [Victoria cruziana]